MGLFDKVFAHSSNDTGYENVLGRYYRLDDLQPVFCGNSGVTLSPLGGAQIMDKHYPTIISAMWEDSPHIKQFFPAMDFSSEKRVLVFMMAAYKITELGSKFTYVITVNHIPAGMFIITTPYFNHKAFGYNHWTMDFFLFAFFEGKGVMSIALPRMLMLLKSVGVEDIRLIVDAHNDRCLNLLKKLPLEEIDNSNWHHETNGQKPIVFNCPLSSISFQIR